MATIAKFTPSPTGATAPTFVAAAEAGDAVNEPGPGCVVILKNSNAATRDVTFAAPGSMPNGVPVPDLTITVPALTGEKWVVLGKEYANSSNQCVVTYADHEDVTIAAVQLP
jgi:hypothetical protein